MLHRFPTGLSGAKVHQKRLPAGAPSWVNTVRLHFPRFGLHADELCVTELAEVIWAVQMSTVDSIRGTRAAPRPSCPTNGELISTRCPTAHSTGCAA